MKKTDALNTARAATAWLNRHGCTTILMIRKDAPGDWSIEVPADVLALFPNIHDIVTGS